ncbi:hypothetical protein HID58_062125, partial [Brassica napus]
VHPTQHFLPSSQSLSYRFTQQLKGEPVPQELLDRLCELIAVLAGGAAAKSEALKEEILAMSLLGLALAFHRKLESYESEPNVVLATSIISKTVGGITYPLFHTLVRPKIDKIERKGLCKTLDNKKLSKERCTEPDASTEIDGSNNILELAPAAIARTTNT